MQQGTGLEQSNERTGGQDPREGERRPCRREGVWAGVGLACRDLWGLAKGLGLLRSPASAAGVTAPSRRGQGGQRSSSVKAALACWIRLNRHRQPLP